MPETKIIAADLGNFELKYWDGNGSPKAIRSTHFRIPNGRTALRFTENSPLIEYKGAKLHFGSQAFKYRSRENTVEQAKESLALLNTFACLEPIAEEFILHVHASHPNPDRAGETMQKLLIGTHELTRNGKLFKVHIQSVCVEPEGYPAYLHAKSINLVPASGFVVLIDIGGGTVCTRLIDEDGEILDQSVSDKGGAYDLAASLSFDDRLIKKLGDRPDPAEIMNAFASGRFHYAEKPEASWKEWFSEYLDPWFRGIFSRIKTQYAPHFPRIRKFLICGGSSHLISDRIQGVPLLSIIPEPRFANVRGLLCR